MDADRHRRGRQIAIEDALLDAGVLVEQPGAALGDAEARVGQGHRHPATGWQCCRHPGKHRRDGFEVLQAHDHGGMVGAAAGQHHIQAAGIAHQVAFPGTGPGLGAVDQSRAGIDAQGAHADAGQHAAEHTVAAGDIEHGLVALRREGAQHRRQDE